MRVNKAKTVALAIFVCSLVLLVSVSFLRRESEGLGLLSELAVATLAASILTLFFEFYREPFLAERLDQLSKIIQGSQSTSLSGIEKVYDNPSRALADFAVMVEHAKTRVEILGAISTPFFWNPDFESAAIRATKRGVEFRVLLLEPTSQAVSLLSRQERRKSDDLSAELRLSLRRWEEIVRRSSIHTSTNRSNSIYLRTYDDLPTAFLMIVDDVLLFAPYLHSTYRISTPFIQAKMSGSISHSLREHFEHVWELAHEPQEQLS